MQQVPVDVEQALAVAALADAMVGPNLVVEGLHPEFPRCLRVAQSLKDKRDNCSSV